VECKNLAAQWGVFLCLDVESSIRGDGDWVQGWLNTSGAGLYGNAPVFNGRTAQFFVLAAYPGYDPKSTWNGPHPGVPTGWQFADGPPEFGCSVDRTWFDDWFATGGDALTPAERQELLAAFVRLGYYLEGNLEFPDGQTYSNWMANAQNQSFDQIIYLSRDSAEGSGYWTDIQGAINLAKQFPAFQQQLNDQLTQIKQSVQQGGIDTNQLTQIIRQELQKALQAAANSEGATQ